MERQAIKLSYELKVQLLKIVNSGQISPEQADEIIPKLDARGKTFNIAEIYKDSDESE